MPRNLASKIPLYSSMTPRRRQQAHLVLGGLAAAMVVLFVSSLIDGPAKIHPASTSELPKPRPLGSVPGAQLDARDAWMGDAGKQLATMRDELRAKEQALTRIQDEQKRDRETMLTQVNQLRTELRMPTVSKDVLAGATGAPGAYAAAMPASGSAPAGPAGAQASARPASGAAAVPTTVATATGIPVVRSAEVFPAQPRTDRLPAPNNGMAGIYPPGSPNAVVQRPLQNGQTGANASLADASVGPGLSLMRVSLAPAAAGSVTSTQVAGGAAAAARASATSTTVQSGAGAAPVQPRQLSNFLPVGFVRAVLLGGLAAPTGGQAQSNPVPVLLRLTDLAMLPNGFRAQMRDCLVIGEGFGDHSAERAYVRTTLLSCVMRDGKVLEVPLGGSVFGEDGMNGVKGPLVTKQGQILANALLAGIASGIGQGISQASQNVTSTALGQVQSAPTDTTGILRSGFGTGVGKALDRLAQYYINLAEKTFPVIEIQPGRTVDIVITKGVPLDQSLDAMASAVPTSAGARDSGRAPLMQALHEVGDDE